MNSFEEPILNTDEEFKIESTKLRKWFEDSLKLEWKRMQHNNSNVNLYELPQEGDIHKTKCRIHCNVSYEQMLKYNQISDEESLKHADKSLIQYKIKYKVEGTQMLVCDTAYTAIWPVASRQFISLHDNYDVENGHIFVQESIKCDKAIPNSKYVLAYKKSGLLIERDPEDDKKCYCERIIMISPRGYIPNFVVAAYKTNDVDEAINYYDKVLNINEENSNALYNKAVALLNKGDKKAANDLFKKAKNFDKSPYILYAIGLNNLRDKKYDSALEMFDICIENNYKTPEIYHAKGQALYGNAEYEQAIQYIDAAINAKSEYYNAWNSRANTLDKMGNKNEALGWYKAAAESKPANSLYLINYCVCLLENGYDEQCKQILTYIESIYQSQKELFSTQEFEFIEKCIKNIHDKFDNGNKNAKVLRLDPSQLENQGFVVHNVMIQLLQ